MPITSAQLHYRSASVKNCLSFARQLEKGSMAAAMQNDQQLQAHLARVEDCQTILQAMKSTVQKVEALEQERGVTRKLLGGN